jgi:hypothetical protein
VSKKRRRSPGSGGRGWAKKPKSENKNARGHNSLAPVRQRPPSPPPSPPTQLGKVLRFVDSCGAQQRQAVRRRIEQRSRQYAERSGRATSIEARFVSAAVKQPAMVRRVLGELQKSCRRAAPPARATTAYCSTMPGWLALPGPQLKRQHCRRQRAGLAGLLKPPTGSGSLLWQHAGLAGPPRPSA